MEVLHLLRLEKHENLYIAYRRDNDELKTLVVTNTEVSSDEMMRLITKRKLLEMKEPYVELYYQHECSRWIVLTGNAFQAYGDNLFCSGGGALSMVFPLFLEALQAINLQVSTDTLSLVKSKIISLT